MFTTSEDKNLMMKINKIELEVGKSYFMDYIYRIKVLKFSTTMKLVKLQLDGWEKKWFNIAAIQARVLEEDLYVKEVLNEA